MDNGSEMPHAMRIVSSRLQREFSVQIGDECHVHCVCHIVNRGVSDAESVLKNNVEKIRSILKVVRMDEIFVERREVERETLNSYLVSSGLARAGVDHRLHGANRGVHSSSEGQECPMLLMQPILFDSRVSLCQNTIDGRNRSDTRGAYLCQLITTKFV